MGGPVENVADNNVADNDAAGLGSIRERQTLAVAAAAAFRDVIPVQDTAMTMMTMGGYGSSRPRKRGGKDEEKKTATTAGGGRGATSAVPTLLALGARMPGMARGWAPPLPAGDPRWQRWRGWAINCPMAGHLLNPC